MTAHSIFSTVIAQAQSAGTSLPTDIQWMPPGAHTVTPKVEGVAKTVTVDVNKELSDRLAAQFRAMSAAAAAGEEDVPFLDFSHKNDAAAGHVEDMFWAGPDPKSGGIRIKVAWTAAGRAALADRQYRRFSPQWLVHKNTGEIIGLSPNMGGLVNHAAFSTIQPVRAQEGETRIYTTESKPMDQNTTAAIAAAVTQALAPIESRLNAIEAAAARATAQATVPAAAQANTRGIGVNTVVGPLGTVVTQSPQSATPNQTLNLTGDDDVSRRLQALEAQAAAAQRSHAESLVAQAQAAGRIPPQDTDARAFWVDAIVAQGSKAEKALAGLAVNPALVRMVNAGASPGTGTTAAGVPLKPDTAEGFVETVRAESAKPGVSKSVAVATAIQANPAGYKAWRDSNGKLGL